MSRSFNPPKRAVGDHIHAVFSDICWTSGLIRRYDPVFVFMATTSQQRDFVSELCVSSWSNLSAGLSWSSRCRCCLCSQFMERQLFVLWLICICAALWESIIFCFGLICNNTPWNNNVVVARSRLARRPEPHHPVWCDVNHSPVWSSIIPQSITFDLFSDFFECVLLMRKIWWMSLIFCHVSGLILGDGASLNLGGLEGGKTKWLSDKYTLITLFCANVVFVNQAQDDRGEQHPLAWVARLHPLRTHFRLELKAEKRQQETSN